MAPAIPVRIRTPISRVFPADSCASLTINLCCCRRGKFGGINASLYDHYFLNGIYTEFFTGVIYAACWDLIVVALQMLPAPRKSAFVL